MQRLRGLEVELVFGSDEMQLNLQDDGQGFDLYCESAKTDG